MTNVTTILYSRFISHVTLQRQTLITCKHNKQFVSDCDTLIKFFVSHFDIVSPLQKQNCDFVTLKHTFCTIIKMKCHQMHFLINNHVKPSSIQFHTIYRSFLAEERKAANGSCYRKKLLIKSILENRKCYHAGITF